jgi:GH3 auxin-responsive promoter
LRTDITRPSLTGEKLYEAQVIQAVQDTARRHRFAPGFFLLVADEQLSSYSLFLETDDVGQSVTRVAADVDHRLGELNVEYHSKRASGRLAPLTIALLRQGSGEAYKSACVRAGQREGQFKPAVLQYRKDLALSFEPYVIP